MINQPDHIPRRATHGQPYLVSFYCARPSAVSGSIFNSDQTESRPLIGPMAVSVATAVITDCPTKTMGTVGEKLSESPNAPIAPRPMPIIFTMIICEMVAVATVKFDAPMALSIPICATFCSVWSWKNPPITNRPIRSVK